MRVIYLAFGSLSMYVESMNIGLGSCTSADDLPVCLQWHAGTTHHRQKVCHARPKQGSPLPSGMAFFMKSIISASESMSGPSESRVRNYCMLEGNVTGMFNQVLSTHPLMVDGR